MPPQDPQLPPDLDKARDEKCIPIAHSILGDFAKSLLTGTEGDAQKHDSIIMSILKKTLEHEMNITTEAQYLFQLILGGFSGLNSTVHSLGEALVPLDEERYAKIGQEMLQILSDAEVRLTKVKPEEVEADWKDAKEKLRELFSREKLNKLETEYILGNIFEEFKVVNNRVAEGLAQSTEKATARLFGVESMTDLTVKHINEALVNDVEVKLTPRPTAEQLAPPEGQVEPPASIPEGGSGQVAPPEPPATATPEAPADAPAGESAAA